MKWWWKARWKENEYHVHFMTKEAPDIEKGCEESGNVGDKAKHTEEP